MSLRLRPAGVIVLGMLAAHGLLLLNDGLHANDDWRFLQRHISAGDWAGLYENFADKGYPIRAYQHQIAAWLPNLVTGHNLVSFASLLGMALLIAAIAQRSGFFGPWEAALLGLLALVFPAYQTDITLSLMPYHLSYVTFLGATWLMLTNDQHRGPRRWAGRGLAWLLFFHSFWIFSFLSVAYGAIALHLGLTLRGAAAPLVPTVARFVRHHADFLLLPILSWGAFQTVFASSTRQDEGYYAPGLHPDLLNDAYLFLQNSVAGPFNRALLALLQTPVWLLVLLVLGRVIYQWARPAEAIQADDGSARGREGVWLLVYGLGLLGLGLVPYLALSFYASPLGWGSRHALLVGLPVAILCAGGLRVLLPDTRLRLSVLSLLVSVFGVATLYTYAGWGAGWMVERAVLAQVTDDMPHAANILLTDEVALGRAYRIDRSPLGHLRAAWNTRETFLLPGYGTGWGMATLYDPVRQHYFPANTADPGHCFLHLYLRDNPQAPNLLNDDLGLVLRYHSFRLLAPDRVPGYLQTLVRAEWTYIRTPGAEDCAPQQALSGEVAAGSIAAMRDHERRLAEAWQMLQQEPFAAQQLLAQADPAERERLAVLGFDPALHIVYDSLP